MPNPSTPGSHRLPTTGYLLDVGSSIRRHKRWALSLPTARPPLIIAPLLIATQPHQRLPIHPFPPILQSRICPISSETQRCVGLTTPRAVMWLSVYHAQQMLTLGLGNRAGVCFPSVLAQNFGSYLSSVSLPSCTTKKACADEGSSIKLSLLPVSRLQSHGYSAWCSG